MIAKTNPLEKPLKKDYSGKQTFELRSPDGSADIYLLIAGICVGARHGFEMPNGLEFAEETFINGNIFFGKNKVKQKSLSQLPDSCKAAAQALFEKADIFKQQGVFTEEIIQGIAKKLKAHNDEDLRERISGNKDETMKLVKKFLHCG